MAGKTKSRLDLLQADQNFVATQRTWSKGWIVSSSFHAAGFDGVVGGKAFGCHPGSKLCFRFFRGLGSELAREP